MLRLEITALLLLLGASQIALADGALLVEQPYGEFGQITPTGHAAIYLSGVCAESPTRLRRCEPGEGGVVLTRNAGVSYDWVAMPAAAYLYAVEDGGRPPAETDRATVNGLRAAYRRSHPTE
ncbi:MAG: hypothetical protein JO122_11900, partial [Acetobacteraceae bacterium]|nr:hypothetical protein [Acetobacteraceae bacterium]